MPTVIRVRKRTTPYVQIDKKPIGDRSLSYKALGLLCYLLSKPDTWEVRMGDLIRSGVEGETSVRAGLKELQDRGYLTRVRLRGPGGRMLGWETTIFETPQLCQAFHRREPGLFDPYPADENPADDPLCGNPNVDEPDPGNRTATLIMREERIIPPAAALEGVMGAGEAELPPVAAAEMGGGQTPGAVDRLVGAGFDPNDARQLITETGASEAQVADAVQRGERKSKAGRLNSTLRGWIVAALRRNDPAPPLSLSQARSPLKTRAQARYEASQRVADANKARRDAESAEEAAFAKLLELNPDDYQRLAAHVATAMPAPIRRQIESKGLECRLLKIEMHRRLASGEWRP